MTHSVEAGLGVERVLLEFPEVEHVVTRIGSPEVATDVMGIELSDVFVILRAEAGVDDREDQARNSSRRWPRQLEHRVPGMGFSFTQPIEMRFNELIAGVRSDVAVRVFGDDLDVLERLGELKSRTCSVGVPARRTSGPIRSRDLPVLRIVLDHARAARYGIPVDDVLGAVEAIRAGRVVGVVMDGVTALRHRRQVRPARSRRISRRFAIFP